MNDEEKLDSHALFHWQRGTTPLNFMGSASSPIPITLPGFEDRQIFFPTLPTPWSSKDEGEVWIAGDFLLTVQREPNTVGASSQLAQGIHPDFGERIRHHFAISVFRHSDINSMGPTDWPSLTIALEQALIRERFCKDSGGFVPIEGDPELGPFMIGVFKDHTHHNLGIFDEDINYQPLKYKFFQILIELGLEPPFKFVGSFSQAQGYFQSKSK